MEARGIAPYLVLNFKKIVYARRGDAEQTTDSQKNAIMNFSYIQGITIYKIYEVHDTPSLAAQSLADALAYMKNNEIDKVITLDPSRISRRAIDLLRIKKEFINPAKEIVYSQAKVRCINPISSI